MTTVFTRIINGELPGRFVWKDETCVAFLSIGPLTHGHTLVVPRAEVDLWTEAEPELVSHLVRVAQAIGTVQVEAFTAQRAGLMVAGYEVPHLHVHVWPSNSLEDFDLDQVDNHPDPADLDEAAEKIRAGLRVAGHTEFVPED
ncbi:HIT family protein [Citricoccus sp. I39-566]|uniref:HIT family protein n=1 Tax=Citricoccus sp. I39-566 TaxID=3073268 RepID=UPI00286ACA85|nr:HIT family protein [Citricoccus sp. I39-566]WMY76970.1 HIT family protein [Citricoccus sp. I39-566]